mgnify:CR=1 FL=1
MADEKKHPWWKRIPPVLHGPDSGRKIAAYIKQHESEQSNGQARRDRTNERQD